MDYTRMAMESNIQMLDMIQEYQMTTMVEESEYIKMCLESGFVVAMEAGNKDGIFAKMRDAFREFLEKIGSLFRKKSVERAKKYKPWIKSDGAKLISKVDTIEPINLAPFWKGKYRADNNKLITAINTAYNNGKAGNIDYSFGTPFVKDLDDIKEHAGTLPTHLKNYFKYNEKGMDAVEPVRVTGAELAKLLPEIAEYIINYDTEAPSLSDKIQQTLNKNLDKIPSEAAVQKATEESFGLNKHYFFSVEGKPITESSLANMINFQAVLEEDKKEVEQQKDKQEAELKKADMKSETDAKIEKADDAEKPAEGEKKEGESSNTNDALVEYYKDLEYFFKLAYTAYQTSLEDRYVQYVNIFLAVAKVVNQTPKFNDKGEYVKPKLVEDGDKVKTDKDGNVVKTKETGGFINKLKQKISKK